MKRKEGRKEGKKEGRRKGRKACASSYTHTPDGAAPSGGHEDDGRVGGVSVGVEDIETETAATVGRVHRACDEHSHQIHLLLILQYACIHVYTHDTHHCQRTTTP